MIAALMLYGIVVSTLVAMCAVGAEWLARRAEIPARPVWAVAMVVMLAFIALAPYRSSDSPAASMNVTGADLVKTSTAPASAFSLATLAHRVADIERSVIIAPIEQGIAFAQSRLPESAGSYLIALWLVASVSLVALMIAVHFRFKGQCVQWPVATLCGSNVRVAPKVGPAVIGIFRPDIVVPRWLLARSDEEQRLVISHESEHMWARDPLLLVFGCTVAAILPWNPAAWWMLSRLRLAVELDCDARVLSRGVAPRKYGDLLIDLAEQRSGFRVSVAALADDSSHLEQRLIAMKPNFPKHVRARAVVVGAFALASLLVACETAMPTASDVNKMDAKSAEKAARSASLLKATDTGTVYTLDNMVVTAAEAKAISADKIASVNIIGSMDKKKAEIQIVTAAKAASVVQLKKTARTAGESDKKFAGLVLINGVKASQAAYLSLDPQTIVSVNVTKPPASVKQYSDPLAANGVISIVTRR